MEIPILEASAQQLHILEHPQSKWCDLSHKMLTSHGEHPALPNTRHDLRGHIQALSVSFLIGVMQRASPLPHYLKESRTQ